MKAPDPSRSIPWRRSVTLTVVLPILAIWLLTKATLSLFKTPDTGDPAARHSTFGQVKLRLKLPGTHAGIPEPLIVCGVAGHASLVFIRLLSQGRAKVGIEFWGLEADESDEFPLPGRQDEIEVSCYLPPFFPPPGSSSWPQVDAAIQRRRQSEYLIIVNGIARLRGAIVYPQPNHSAIYFGVNPLGGSLVSARYTGTILQATQGY